MIKLLLSARTWVVAKLQGDKSASQSSMELYYTWISRPPIRFFPKSEGKDPAPQSAKKSEGSRHEIREKKRSARSGPHNYKRVPPPPPPPPAEFWRRVGLYWSSSKKSRKGFRRSTSVDKQNAFLGRCRVGVRVLFGLCFQRWSFK